MRRVTRANLAPLGTLPLVVRNHRPVLPLRCASVTGPMVVWPRALSAPESQVTVSVAWSVCVLKPPSQADRVNSARLPLISFLFLASESIWLAVATASSLPPAKNHLPFALGRWLPGPGNPPAVPYLTAVNPLVLAIVQPGTVTAPSADVFAFSAPGSLIRFTTLWRIRRSEEH